MSVNLIKEVLLYAPDDLTPAERMLLVVIAESCNKETRSTWFRDGWGKDEVCRRSGIAPASLSKTLWSLAKKGVEVRVPHAVKDGKPVFAFRGKQTTFKLPTLSPERSDEDRTFLQPPAEKGPTYVAESPDAGRPFDAESPDVRRTLPLKDLPSKNTSSPLPPAINSTAEVGHANPEEEGKIDQKEEDPRTALINLVRGHRPDWSVRAITKAITEAEADGRSWERIAWVLPVIALDPATQKPGRLNAGGHDYWEQRPAVVCDSCGGSGKVEYEMYGTTEKCRPCAGGGYIDNPPAGPEDDTRCAKHPSYRASKCGSCRADDLVAGTETPHAVRLDRQPPTSERWLGRQRKGGSLDWESPADRALRAHADMYREVLLREERDRERRKASGEYVPYRNPVNQDDYDLPL